MQILKQYSINNVGKVSSAFLNKGIQNYAAALAYIKKIPYQRNKDKQQLLCVLSENKGTCSSKHALLKRLADELQLPIQLFLGIFKMHGANMPKLQAILKEYELEYIPEVHCYLKYQGIIIDCTFPEEGRGFDFEADFIEEEAIAAEQTIDYKVTYHKSYLAEWLKKQHQIPYSLAEIWQIRETCIQKLSE